MGHWSKKLRELGACREAMEWAKTQPSAKVAWKKCERADWLLWILGRTDKSVPWSEKRKPLVRCALACAAEGLKYIKEGETKEATEVCISVTQAWCDGAATREEVMEVRAYAADAAAYAAYAAADAAAYAAAAAANAAANAAYAYAYTAANAAYAANANAAYAANAAARSRVLRELCEIVCSHFPNPPELS